MTNVTDIWLFVQTSEGSNASLNLTINRTVGGPVVLATDGQHTSTNGIKTPGTTAQFIWQQGGANWPVGALTRSNLASFTLGITGPHAADAWMPNAIRVIYRCDTGANSLGPQDPKWPTMQYFSSDPSARGARASWPLSWNPDPIVAFDSGGITEARLKPSDSATYQFQVTNLLTTTIDGIVLGLQYNEQEYAREGVTFGVGTGEHGMPEINVAASIPPGGSTPVSFAISTSNARPRTYSFNVKLLGLSAAWDAIASFRRSADKPHEFTVVSS